MLRDNGSIGFKDLQHDYPLVHAPGPALLHFELLASHRRQLPDAAAGRLRPVTTS